MRWSSARLSRPQRARVLVALSALALLGFRDPGCGGGGGDRAGLNGPCTRSRDCDPRLQCLEGVCVAEDAGVRDAATVDAKVDTGVDAADASELDAADAAAPDAADGGDG